ncbi:MAG: phosphotransferase [Geobacteraceae bacterium]|nr:phosphotransferase [Geobacteraceae bacterium]
MGGDGLMRIFGLAPESPVLLVGAGPSGWREVFPTATVCPRFPRNGYLPDKFELVVYHCAAAADARAFREDVAAAAENLAGKGSILALAENACSFRNLKRLARGEWALFASKLFRGSRRCEKELKKLGFEEIRRFYALPSLEQPEELVALGSPLLELPHYWHPLIHYAKKFGLYRALADGVVLFAGSVPLETAGIVRFVIDSLSQCDEQATGRWTVERIDIRKRGAVVLFLTDVSSGQGIIARVVSDSGIDRIISKNHNFLESLASNPSLGQDFRDLLPRPLCRLEYAGSTVYVETMLRGLPAWKVNRGPLQAVISRNALEFLMLLGSATGKVELLQDDALDGLFRDDLALIENSSVISPDFRENLLRLVRELTDRLSGREVRMATSHGDYGYGNILVDQRSGALTGVIDWDTARLRDLPGIDLFNLQVQQERAARNCGACEAFSSVIRGSWRNQRLQPYLEELGIDKEMTGMALYLSFLRYTTRALQYPDLFLEEQEDFRSILGLLRGAVPI